MLAALVFALAHTAPAQGSPEVLWAIAGHRSTPIDFDFSPDGKILATTGAGDESAKLWRVSDGAFIRSFFDHDGGIYRAAFSPDGRLIAFAVAYGNLRVVRIRRVSDGKLLREIPFAGPDDVVFLPDGESIMAIGTGVRQYRVSDGTLIRSFPHGSAQRVAISPNGELMVTSGYEGVLVWRIADGVRLFTVPTGAYGVAFAPNGTDFASAGGSVFLWRISQTGVRMVWRQDRVSSFVVAFSPDGHLSRLETCMVRPLVF